MNMVGKNCRGKKDIQKKWLKGLHIFVAVIISMPFFCF